MNHQPEASFRLDPPTDLRPAAPEASALPEGWTSLNDCLLEPRPVEGMPAATILVPVVLLHPEFGVALLGLPGAVAEAAAAAFRQRLEDARFSAIFPGHLPVATLAMLPGEPLNLRRRLSAAFATLPPLDLAGGDGWMTVVSRLLQSRPLVRPPTPRPRRERPLPDAPPARMAPSRAESARAAQARLESARTARLAVPELPWRTLGPMLGLAGGGLLVGLLVGLNHQPAAPLQSGTEAAPRPATSAPPPRAEAQAPQAPAPQAPAPQAQAPAPQRQAATRPPPPVAPAAPVPAPPAPVAVAPAAPPPSPAPVASPGSTLPRVLVRTPANLRVGPDSSAPVLRTAARGEAFRVYGEARGGWIQVGGTAPEGWIHSSLLTEP